MWTSGVIGSARPSSHGAVAGSERAAASNAAGSARRRRSSSSSVGIASVIAERPVVADERAVLDVAEVSTDRPGARRQFGIGQQAVEAAGVHDPGVLDRLGHFAGADLGQPLGHRAAPTVRCHDEVGSEFGPVVESHPGHGRDAAELRDPTAGARLVRFRAGRVGEASVRRAVAARPVRIVTFGFGERGPAQHPLEGRAAAGDHHQVLVAGFGRELHLGRNAVAETHLGGTLGEQCLEDVGLMVAQQIAQPCEEGVAVADLRGAPPVPLERLVGGRRHRCVVALDHRHLVARPAELQRRRQTRPRRHRSPRRSRLDTTSRRPSNVARRSRPPARSMYWK